MLHNRSIPNLFFKSMTFMAMGLLIVVGLVWTLYIYQDFQGKIEHDRAQYVETQKTRISTFVNRAFDYVEFANSQAQTRLKKSIQIYTENAISLSWHLYETHKDTMSEAALKRLIIEALRPQRFNNGRGYYFITALDGTEMLFADKPELEGKNLLNLQSADNKYVIRDMIAIAREHGQGFYEYEWTKPESEGNGHAKTAFIKYFEPFDWLIGTGEYLEDGKKDTQNEVLEWLVRARFGEYGYLFGSIRGGDPLFTNGKITRGGNNIIDLTDADGVKIIQKQHKIAFASHEGGFVNYSWRKLKGEEPTPKIVFVRSFPDWDWVIGSGVYIDNIETSLEQRRDTLYKKMSLGLIQVAILFVVAFGITATISLALSKRLRREIDLMTDFFFRARSEEKLLDPDVLTLPEFRGMAESANVMISSRAEAKAGREVLIHELKDKNEELERFTYTVSHDLKSPIITIKGFIGVLKEDIAAADNIRIGQDIEYIDQAAGRMGQLLDELLELSRVSRITPAHEEVPLNALVGEVIEQLHGRLSERNVDIKLSSSLPTVQCARTRIFEVFQNLIENAIKFVAQDTTPTIEIGMRETDGEQIFFVRDNGIGIEEQYHNKVFGLFEQLNQQYEGTGIGLALVKRIVENHNGRLWIESEGTNKGTTFCFTLRPKPKT